MRNAGALDDAGWETLDAEVKTEVEDAYAFAESSPDPEASELYANVYAKPGGPG